MTHPLYALIEPASKTVMFDRFTDYKDALASVGLANVGVDFGTIARRQDGSTLTIIVYEYGLIDGGKQFPDQYWALDGRLFNGPAVLYAANEEGETIDVPPGIVKPTFQNILDEKKSQLESHIIWIGTGDEAERLIARGAVDRPQNTINGEVIWEWKAGTP